MSQNITTITNPSPEFVRRSADGGLELVRLVDGEQVVVKVELTARIEKIDDNRQQIVIGIKPVISTSPQKSA